ncbi:MAG: aminoglycoside phosphotransferase family protein [bacterium]
MGNHIRTQVDFKSIVSHFRAWGDMIDAKPHGTGHINDTFKVTFSMAGAPVHYLLQRINHGIFKDPVALMDNILRVTNHLRMKMSRGGIADVTRHSLCVVMTRNAKTCYNDHEGNWWRMYLFVEGAVTYDKVESVRQAYEAARAYARFQLGLADLPPPRLHETIPDFHNTTMRLKTLQDVIQSDPCNRAAEVKEQIAFVERRTAMCGRLLDRFAKGEIPERITHNDTKFNNVMLDEKTWEGVCVVDLDTVMPGLALYDFGDMVRSATASANEDEQDMRKVRMRMEMFEALARGYLSEASAFLNPAELEELVFSARLITLEIGMRFLTDYLQGDTYFKIKRPSHNIDRCRGQFKMVESMEAQEDAMERVVGDCLRGNA